MSCPHPSGERQRVYEGRLEPRPDRAYCALCGDVIYVAVIAESDEGRPLVVAPRVAMRDSARHG